MSFSSLAKGITPKMCRSFVLINSVLLNLSCVWILRASPAVGIATFVISAFPIHSASFYPVLVSSAKKEEEKNPGM